MKKACHILSIFQMNSRFIKKIPPGSEVVNLLTGEIDELDRRVAAFVRLKVSFARIRGVIPSYLRSERIRQSCGCICRFSLFLRDPFFPYYHLEVSFFRIRCDNSTD